MVFALILEESNLRSWWNHCGIPGSLSKAVDLYKALSSTRLTFKVSHFQLLQFDFRNKSRKLFWYSEHNKKITGHSRILLGESAMTVGLFPEMRIYRKRRKRTIWNKSKLLTTRWNRWILMESCRIVQGVVLDDLFSGQAIFRSSNSIKSEYYLLLFYFSHSQY